MEDGQEGACVTILMYDTAVTILMYDTAVTIRRSNLRPCVEDGQEGVVAVELDQTMPDHLHAARCVGTCLVQDQ